MSSSTAAEKMIEGLTLIMEAFAKLQEHIETEYGAGENDELDVEDEGASELSLEIDAAIVTEVRAIIENVVETEEYATEEIAALISTMTDALEEIDPDVFDESDSDDDAEETEDVDYEEDDAYDEYEESDEDYADEEFGEDDLK